MATQEQIDAFLELDRRGAFKDKDPELVNELRSRFAPKEEQPLRTIPLMGDDRIDIFPPRPSKYDKFISDKGGETYLRAPGIRKFISDANGKNVIDPAGEAVQETAGEFVKSNLNALTLNNFLGMGPEKVTRAIEEASGVPRETDIPFAQDLGASGLMGIGMGEVAGTVLKPLVPKAVANVFTKQRALPWAKNPAVVAQEVAKGAVDELAPQAVKEEAQAIASRTPEKIVDDVVKKQDNYSVVQKQIDDFEDILVKKGIDVTKLATKEELKKLPSTWREIPKELEKLYIKRDSIGAGELEQSINELTRRLKGMGLDSKESEKVLESYSITGTSSAEQSLASTWAKEVASRDPKEQVEKLVYSLSELRGESEISKKTKIDSIKAVREITDYFGTFLKEGIEKKPVFLGMPTTPKPLGEMLNEKAGAINLDYINTADDVKSMMKDIAEKAPSAFKGSVVPVQEMIDSALDVGLTEGDILSGKLGTLKDIHPRILAGRQILTKASEDLFEIQKKMLSPESTPKDLVNFRVAFDKAVAISKAVREPISEIARTLRSQQIAVGSQEFRAKAMKEVLKSMEGKKMTEELARRFGTVDMKSPREVAIFLREMSDASTSDKIFEGYRNFLLSSPLTPVRNAIGNTFAALSRTIERPVSTVLDIGRAAVTGTKRERFFGELPKEVQAQFFGAWQGLKDGRIAFNQELPIFGFDKFQEAAQPLAIKGTLGRVIRIPQRLAMAADEPFKAILYKGELASTAYREATKEGLTGAARNAKIAELLVSPTDAMKKSAQEVAQHFTFQDPLGPIGNWVSQGRERIPGLRYIVPFIQVASNIPKFVAKRTPLYLPWITKRIVDGSLKGGAISDELAKVATGTIALTPIMQAVHEGNITGSGPSDPGARNVWLETHQPYSVKIGNTWHQLKGIEPAGTLMGAMADFHEIWNRMEKEDAVVALGIAIAKNMTNATYMTGLRDVIDAVTDPERHGEKFATRLAGSVVPNVIGSVTRAIEPELRKPKGAIQAIKARLPLVDKTDIPPVLGIWGQPIIREGTVASRLFWPITKKTLPDDAATLEVDRLGMSVGSPSKSLGGIALKPNEYLFYARYSGKVAHDAVMEIMKNKDYQNLPDPHKEEAIQRVFSRARRQAKMRMISESESFRGKFIEKKQKEAMGVE